MIEPVFITYCATIFIASIIPGPSMMLAMNTCQQKHGLMLGNMAALGNVVASLLQALISLLVIYTIGGVSDGLMAVVRTAGAGYIIYIGVRLFIAPRIDADDNGGIKTQMLTAFNQGFLLAIANPKAIIFFVAFFPSFIKTSSSVASQTVIILLPIALIAYVCFLAYAIAGRVLKNLFTNSIWLTRAFAVGIMATGVSMFFM
ncbi:LysE family translocator [Klebsiella sp. PL-2018]|uniref:LysE family translocator n=1 Tax=Klebsiella sp. PL-2018 TaxID=2851540 RepID=UPI001C238892|nr:LysE family translocator [Klebsiella sp. PL-2018]QXD01108.1 Homoserine/homoserine lactone efflux protein [Klebsiella sp. PL-2018]